MLSGFKLSINSESHTGISFFSISFSETFERICLAETDTVVVTAEQPATKLVGSRLVTSIPGTNLARLGNALDVLAQLPMIKVEDTEVSVIGKSNIEIYIDGRPLRDRQELQQILSSSLKKVELLMAPGFEYESTTGAVLKITTKRNFVQGMSLNNRFQLQQRRKWSVTEYLGLSYRTGNWELFIDGTVNHNNSKAKGSTENTLIYEGKPTKVGSTRHNSYPTTTGVVKAEFNFRKGNNHLAHTTGIILKKGILTTTVRNGSTTILLSIE